jgi:ABC-type transport system substrate-binding protein
MPTHSCTDRAKNLMGLTSVTTPNPTTIVFHLKHPFSDFNYVVAFRQTVQVPPSADTGVNYQLHVVPTGPHKFPSYTLNNRVSVLNRDAAGGSRLPAWPVRGRQLRGSGYFP